MIVMTNPVRVAMVTPIVVILCFLFFGVSHVFMVLPHSPVIQPTKGKMKHMKEILV